MKEEIACLSICVLFVIQFTMSIVIWKVGIKNNTAVTDYWEDVIDKRKQLETEWQAPFISDIRVIDAYKDADNLFETSCQEMF